MTNKIRLGFVGANVSSTWSSQSHCPALMASPDVELTAVCTTRPASAEEARQAFGAKLAFHDFRAMGLSPEKRIPRLGRTAEHLVTFDWSPALLERGYHLVGDAPYGIQHDVARDR